MFRGDCRAVFNDHGGALVAGCIGKGFNAVDGDKAIDVRFGKRADKAENNGQRQVAQIVSPVLEQANNFGGVCQLCLLFGTFSDS